MSVPHRARGMTLLEITISTAIMAIVVLGALGLVKDEVNVVGAVANNDYTAGAAQSALWRIRNELLSVVQNPQGVTSAVAPAYDVSSPDTSPLQFSSITWRPVLGFIDASDPNYSTYAQQGRVSTNHVLYDSVAKRLWVDTTTYAPVNVLKLDTIAGPSTSTTVVRSEVLLGNRSIGQSVTAFRLYDGEACGAAGNNVFWWNSTASPSYAPGATASTYLIGVYLRVEHRSVNPNDLGKNTTSNYDSSTNDATDLRTCVLVQPETLTNSQGKPYVGGM